MLTKTALGPYDLYTISSGNLSVSVTTYGAAVTSLLYHGREMVLKYETAEEYEAGTSCLCACIGRYANRIAGASFPLNGKTVSLTANEGKNTLHSGPDSLHHRVWNAEAVGENAVRLFILSPNGDNGFPGNLEMSVTFSVSDSVLRLDFNGRSDQDTVFAPTFHPYFNFDGREDVRTATLQINASGHLEVGPGLIPTGKILPAEGDFDFSKPRTIDRNFDDCFVLNDEKACTLQMGDVTMEMHTDFPAVQVYTGEFLTSPFHADEGLAIEPEFFPDSPNHANFPSTILRANEDFHRWCEFRF